MQTSQIKWTVAEGWVLSPANFLLQHADLVFVFADSDRFRDAECFEELKLRFPNAIIVGCSSAGSIMNTSISDDDVVATAVLLEKGQVRMVSADIRLGEDTATLGANLVAQLQADDLKHVFILADGVLINGSDLAKGFNQSSVSVTGGLAGDGTRFDKTWVMANAPAKTGCIAAIGLYGDLTVKTGCFAGWQEFGAERIVTKSSGNIVYEIDNKPALTLYKKYLGNFANELPSSGLRFPLGIRANQDTQLITRTLLAIDEKYQTLTFAGDVPQGHLCKLMMTNIESLINHAGMAAESAAPNQMNMSGLCLIISCVGRRLVLKQLTEDELEIVRKNIGNNAAMTGFYSYGEFATFGELAQCQLHNQTMTITTIFN